MSHLIGTAGHVDHGKTTLIRALTGIDADRLPEEKLRGMTIDIGFAYIELPGIGRVSIVDVPGHERFIRNMLVGALGVDVALLCVAADEGVKPQTREHFQILEMLPVDRMVVALTRSDLADEDTRELAGLEVAELLEGTRFMGAPMVVVSTVTGEGIAELKQKLAESLVHSGGGSKGPWYLPIDRTFTVKGQGCVVTGTLALGSVKNGDPAVLSPGGREVRVRAVHVHGEPADSADFGKRVALNLGGIKLADLHRGQVVGAPGAVFDTDILDASVRWIAPVKHSQRVRLSIGAVEAIGRVFLSDAQPEIAQIRLESVIACAREQPLILRQYSPPILLGGGKVTIPQARKRRKNEAILGQGTKTINNNDSTPHGQDSNSPLPPTVDPLPRHEAQGSSPAQHPLSDSITALLSQAPNGLPTEEICRLTSRTAQELGMTLEQLSRDGQALGLGGLWLSLEAFEAARSRFLEALSAIHEEQPTKLWQPREAALRKAELKWTGKPLERFLSALAARGDLRVEGTMVKRSDFKVRLSDKQRAFLDRVVATLDSGGINSGSSRDLARALTVPPQAIEEILKLGFEAGEIVRLPDGIYYSASQIQVVKETISKLFGAAAFSAGEFRDKTGTSRKYAIPILEHLDSVGFTLRTGDTRVVRR